MALGADDAGITRVSAVRRGRADLFVIVGWTAQGGGILRAGRPPRSVRSCLVGSASMPWAFAADARPSDVSSTVRRSWWRCRGFQGPGAVARGVEPDRRT